MELYGKYKAKINLDILEQKKGNPNGKYILVTSITPTPLGEGKTVNAIGLSMGLNKLGKSAVCCIRQPSLGPTFGIKGGAAGGGYSQVIPMEDFNLHLTGDTHAVTAAHNLLAAFLDNALHHKNLLDIDLHSIVWKRAMDISDRALRKIVIGLGGRTNGIPRESGFIITSASEIMAILSLATSLADLRQRLGRIVLAYRNDGQAVTAEDLSCAGAMAVLMKDAIKPNLMQTIEHTPCFVHAGPFANIAPGNSSVLADRIAIKCADFVITEAGFGADMGAEKFANIKCRISGLIPAAALLVCSVRSIKMHSGKYDVKPGKPLDANLTIENIPHLLLGMPNLEKQIENIKIYGIPVVVAINRFDSDTDSEIKTIQEAGMKSGAHAVVISDAWARGGEGSLAMAEAIADAARGESEFRPLYEPDIGIKEKIEQIARKIYGAGSIYYEPLANRQIKQFTEQGFGKYPICVAKTHLSLSHNPNLKGRPEGYEISVNQVGISAGAGFLYVLLGDIMTMPGLHSTPGGTRVDIGSDGVVHGLF